MNIQDLDMQEINDKIIETEVLLHDLKERRMELAVVMLRERRMAEQVDRMPVNG